MDASVSNSQYQFEEKERKKQETETESRSVRWDISVTGEIKREIRFTYPSAYTDTSDPMHNAGVAISNAVA